MFLVLISAIADELRTTNGPPCADMRQATNGERKELCELINTPLLP